MLVNYYFSSTDSLYNESVFERCLSVPKVVVSRLFDAVNVIDPFIQKENFCTRRLGIWPMVRFVVSMRMLKYSNYAHRLDAHLQLLETVSSDALKSFFRIVVDRFKAQYLNRCPTPAEKESVSEATKQRGLPGYFVPWDREHFLWRKFPVILSGQCKGKEKGVN